MPIISKQLNFYKCNRCGKEWQPQSKEEMGLFIDLDYAILEINLDRANIIKARLKELKPKVCPGCKSAYWDSPRVHKVKPVSSG